MTVQEHLLVGIMEECDELSQRISKALRFGMEEVQPGQELTNRQRIIYELNDLIGLLKFASLYEERVTQQRDKVAKFNKYLEYADSLRMVRDA